ncbi:ATP-binding protein [Bradyrhizobium roseum]|uniref:ATP-binding protein n=1 Tax=Bradyrhizobium roseum TaxID=3056648 RepID=UPI0026036492|nr:ATP-binding protein [Bradyrhizobium roseus]WKA29842.1 ATP-binding protein [Bradyrhizobium roseus]
MAPEGQAIISTASAPKGPRLTYWDGGSSSSLISALSPPATQCIEADLADECQIAEPRHRIMGHLSLLVTTKSAYRHHISRAFVEAIESRTTLSNDLHDRIYTATQEAVMNAVLHGNLRIEAGLRDNLERFVEFHESIERKLALPEVAGGMVRVDALWNSKMLYVVIRDSGDGYDKAAVPSLSETIGDSPVGRGRGLSILETICDRVVLLHGGRAIKLGFRI